MIIWKDIINYEELYQVNNFGEIKSLITNKILKPYENPKNGYLYIGLSKNKIHKNFLIHRIIAEHFIDNIFNLEQVNHIDKNKLNNIVENLEWVSHRENNCHKFINKDKFIGVLYIKKSNKYRAYIKWNNKTIHIGLYNTPEEAYNARINFEKENNIINKYS